MKSLGNFIRYVRKTKGLTQEQVSEKLNIVPPVLSKWENDKSLPPLEMQFGLCNILEVSVEECISAELSDGEKILPPRIYEPLKLGKNIKRLRIKNGWSQSELGKKLFVASQTVSKWEAGGVSSLEILRKLSETFGVSPSQLIYGSESPKQKSIEVNARPKKLKKTVIKITVIILSVILVLGFTAGLSAGLIMKNKKQDGAQTPPDSNEPESPSDGEQDEKVLEFIVPVGAFYSASQSVYNPILARYGPVALYFETVADSEIYASEDGEVKFGGVLNQTLIIVHGGGYISQYENAGEFTVSDGEKVKKGQVIAKKTVSHYVSFGMKFNGETVAPLDFLPELPEPVPRL